MTLFDYGVTAKTGPATGFLQPGVPDLSAFPFAVWQKLTQRHSGRAALAGMADAMGYLPLRLALKDYLRQSRQVVCDENCILITPGAGAACCCLLRRSFASKPGGIRLDGTRGLSAFTSGIATGRQIHYIDASSDIGLAT